MENFTPTLQDLRRYRVVDGKASIELKLKSPHHLFDERDPAPFRERDLDDDAARYIVSSFRELPSDRDRKLSLYFAGLGEFEGQGGDVIRKAIHSHFAYEAELKRRELRETFRQGFISLLIGLAFLSVCTWFSLSVPKGAPADFAQSLFKEWLFIIWWVAMWKPVSIFLYDWWPIWNSMRTLRELSHIEIEVLPLSTAAARTEASVLRQEPLPSLPLTGLKTS